jgi:antitoxin HigA-1
MKFPVTIDPDVMSGTPVFTGTRVPVIILFDHIDNGATIEEFLIGFSGVSREQVDDYLVGINKLQFNAPHPGEFISEIYLKPLAISAVQFATKINVTESTVHRLIEGRLSVSEAMAKRLSKVIGRSPESWLAMQRNYDLWKTIPNPPISKNLIK